MKTPEKVRGGICLYPKKRTLSIQPDSPEVYQLYPLRAGVIGDKEVIYYAAKAAHVPQSTVILAEEALFDAINYFCTQGHTVQMPGLGAFGMQFQTETADTPEEVNEQCIKRKYLRFWAKKEIRQQCNLENLTVEVKDLLGLLKEEADNAEDEQP